MRNLKIIIQCAHLGLVVCTECSTLVTAAAAASPNVLLAITHRGKNVATRRQEGGKAFSVSSLKLVEVVVLNFFSFPLVRGFVTPHHTPYRTTPLHYTHRL